MSQKHDKQKFNDDEAIRVDKWLWAARFFKTRGLASEAIKSGKIDINGQRCKPSKTIQVGDVLRVRKNQFVHEITVRGVSKNRGPASVAVGLYEESENSIATREALAAQLKASNATRPTYPGRPSKRDRRQIIRFTRKSSEEEA